MYEVHIDKIPVKYMDIVRIYKRLKTRVSSLAAWQVAQQPLYGDLLSARYQNIILHLIHAHALTIRSIRNIYILYVIRKTGESMLRFRAFASTNIHYVSLSICM